MSEKERGTAQEETQGHILNNDGQPERPKLFGWLASLVTISLIIVSQFLMRGDNPYLRGTGVLVLLSAGVFIFGPFYLLAKYGAEKGDQIYMQTGGVVDRGLFAVTRHPQYLGYILLACGFALLSQHWATILLAVMGTALFYLQAVQEERYCLTRFGAPYRQYLQRVPRLNIILGIIRLFRGGRM